MTRKRIIGGALAFAVAFLLSVAAFAQHGGPQGGGRGHHGPDGPGGLLGPAARELNLTDAQKAQVKQITDAFQESAKSLHEQLFNLGGGPFDGLKDGAFDEAAVRAAAQARAAIHVELEVAHAKAASQVYAVLTAEQKAKLAELQEKFKQQHAHHPPPPGGEGF